MQIFHIAVAAALAVVVTAQGTGQLPTCAQGCAQRLIQSTGCPLANVDCICQSSGFITNISCCVFENCNTADQVSALDYARNICSSSNVSLPASAGCSGSSSATATSASGSATGTSSTGTGSVTSAVTTTRASGSSSMMSSTASAASTSSSGAANKLNAAYGLGAAVVGAVAML